MAAETVLASTGEDKPRFEEACKIWNLSIPTRPRIVVFCETPEHVVTALRDARKLEPRQGALVSVRSGGHNIAGKALCSGVVLHLGKMQEVRVTPSDPSFGGMPTARVQGGATWAHVDKACVAAGFATVGGLISTTGMGLLVGGGIGWLSRSRGLACDALVGATVVTGSGQVWEDVTDESHPDLMWALRGAGGAATLGVVCTEFVVRLAPILPLQFCFMHYEASDFAFEAWQTVCATAPRALAVYAFLAHQPGKAQKYRFSVALAVDMVAAANHPSDEQTCDKALEILLGRNPVNGTYESSMAYDQLNSQFDAANGPGHWYYKGAFFRALPPRFPQDLLKFLCQAKAPTTCTVEIQLLGGAMSDDRFAQRSCYAHRDAMYEVHCIVSWEEHEASAPYFAFAAAFGKFLTSCGGSGTYINYATADAYADGPRAAAAFHGAAATTERLAALRAELDPDALFKWQPPSASK